MSNILDEYVTAPPSAQNALNIFKDEWTSHLPPEMSDLIAGTMPLFQDQRITWAMTQLGGVQGCNILELGPLEAGHTYMLEKMGANSILAVEANSRAYIKCLIIKEVLNLRRAKFLLGDFVAYLQQTSETFDVCVASGVLYHMKQPAELINLIAKVSTKVMLWTHYYNPDNIHLNPHQFKESTHEVYEGFKHALYKQDYPTKLLESKKSCAGMQHFSCWMSRQDILRCLEHFGFKNIQINFEQVDHPHGSCFCLVATRE
ncbi:MAG: class I SAM-dependent methyltransferase [Thiotrichaceae bacterium]